MRRSELPHLLWICLWRVTWQPSCPRPAVLPAWPFPVPAPPCHLLTPLLAEVPLNHTAMFLSVFRSLEMHLFLCSISLINIFCLVLLITSIYLHSVISSAVSLLFIFPSCLIFLFLPFISVYLHSSLDLSLKLLFPPFLKGAVNQLA